MCFPSSRTLPFDEFVKRASQESGTSEEHFFCPVSGLCYCWIPDLENQEWHIIVIGGEVLFACFRRRSEESKIF